MNLKTILEEMIKRDASDIFIRPNSPLKGRITGAIETMIDEAITLGDIEKILQQIAKDKDRESLRLNRSCEFAYWYKDSWRFRVGVFYQRNVPSIVIRKINLDVANFEQLNLPSTVLEKFCNQRRGLVLLTGITGSGKSTAIASMIEYINNNLPRHILTVEEPIEFTFEDKKNQFNC